MGLYGRIRGRKGVGEGLNREEDNRFGVPLFQDEGLEKKEIKNICFDFCFYNL
jgi:hypothetical protein